MPKVPAANKPARKVRKNKGVKRGPRVPKVLEAVANVVENVANAVGDVFRPARKVRSNKGVKRGPRKPAAAKSPKAVKAAKSPKAVKVKMLSPGRVVRHPANRPVALNKGKFLVSMKFNLRNTRRPNNNKLNNNGNPLFSEANKKILRNTKLPSNKEFSNYMAKMNGNMPLHRRYLENLYSYGSYGQTPSVKNYKNGAVRYVIDPTRKGFNGGALFPTAKSIKNNLNGQSLANGIWTAAPGGHGVYPVKMNNGTLGELGVIGFKNVKVSKI